MPTFTIETTYRLPVYRQRAYDANTLDHACRRAIEDDDWSEQKEDCESSGETYVTGAWAGDVQPYSAPALPIPPQFDETVQRKADHFETLLGLLKIVASDAHHGRPTSVYWRGRVGSAIAKAEAILAGEPDPNSAIDAPTRSHVLATLQESCVRDQIETIIETDPEFAHLTTGSVMDCDIHTACLVVAAAIDLSEETGAAEFRAALGALREAARRRTEGDPS